MCGPQINLRKAEGRKRQVVLYEYAFVGLFFVFLINDIKFSLMASIHFISFKIEQGQAVFDNFIFFPPTGTFSKSYTFFLLDAKEGGSLRLQEADKTLLHFARYFRPLHFLLFKTLLLATSSKTFQWE